MSIHFFSEDVLIPNIDFKVVKNILGSEISDNGYKAGTVNFIFCSDSYLLSLNTQFLKHDYFTDVISFDYSEDLVVSGDIYISTDMVLNNSVTFSVDYHQELFRVISHGLLHLLGFNDKNSDEIFLMRKKETELIDKFGHSHDLL